MTSDINKLKKKIEQIEKREVNYLNSNNKKILNRCKYEFNKYQDKSSYYYDSTNELYNYIKDRYIKMIDQGNLDIKIERIRIERCLGAHKKMSGIIDKNNVSIGSNFMFLLINIMITYFNTFHKSEIVNSVIYLVEIAVGVGLVALYIKQSRCESIHEKDLVNYISLKVLDDIEKGIIE